MAIDPELHAMAKVYDALHNLDESTRNSVVDWVKTKLNNSTNPSTLPVKRGPNPGKKQGPKAGYKRKAKRGRPPGSKNKQ